MTVSKPVAVCLLVSLALGWLCALAWPTIWLELLGLAALLLAGVMHTALRLAAGPRPRAEQTASGVLPFAEFAAECEQRLRAKAEPSPELPDALPAGLRDPGFVRRAQAIEAAQRRVYRLDELEHDLIRGGSFRYHNLDRMRSMYGKRREAQDELHAVEQAPAVTDRAYTALTHCPEGHIGHHWLGDLVDDEAVARTCWWARCGATWKEQAWTTAA